MIKAYLRKPPTKYRRKIDCLTGTIYYKNPWGWTLWGSRPMDFFGEVGWLQRDANIDFYDEQVTKYEIGVLLSW